MASKADKEQLAAEWLDNFLTKDLPEQEDISYNGLVKKMVLQFGVTTFFVDKWIERFYVAEGKVIIKEGIIAVPKKQKQGE